MVDALPKARRGTHPMLFNAANMVDEMGLNALAEPLLREVMTARPDDLEAKNNLGFNLITQDKFAEAEMLFRDLVAIKLTQLGPDHLNTILSVGNLGWSLLEQGAGAKLAEAEQLLLGVVEHLRARSETQRTRPDLYVLFYGCLADAQRQQKRPPPADEMRTSVALARKSLGSGHAYTLRLEAIATLVLHTGGASETEELRSVVRRMHEFLGPQYHWTRKYQAILDLLVGCPTGAHTSVMTFAA